MSADENEKVSVLTERIGNLIDRLDKFEGIVESRFVTRAEFTPVQRIVYGGVSIILSLVMVALIGAVIIHR